MCCPDPMFAFDIDGARVDKAIAIIGGLKQKLSTDDAIDVAFELGLGDVVVYDIADKRLRIDFRTDLQIVAYAAACAAAAEVKGRKKAVSK